MSDRIEAEIIDVLGEEVAAAVDTPLVVIEGPKGEPGAPGKDGAGMDITGATVGQIAKIAAVDASGVPTAWSPADMPSGGSSDFVITGSLTEAGGITLDKTFAQIQEAVQAGKTALMRVDGGPTTITLPLAVKNSDISTEYDFSIGYFIEGRLNGVTVRVMESGPVLYTASTPTNNPDGTMPQVSMAAEPTEDMQIATKQYVDTHATGGTDMGITGAEVGQIAKITAVDASGVPTAWSPADMPSGGSHDAVLYTAQELTYGQKFQARKNIEAADRVMPTITGGVSLCPANVTDSNTAVHTTTTTSGGDDFTLTLDGGPENALVRVKGIRTPTDTDTNAAATVEYVKAAIPTALKNPNALTIKIGGTTVTYDGSAAKTVTIADGSEVAY